MLTPRPSIQKFCVTAAQMQAIEAQLLEAGFPVAALMEKVAGRIAEYVTGYIARHIAGCTAGRTAGHAMDRWLPGRQRGQTIGVLVGPGHNGGDALVVARELFLQGYDVVIYGPFERYKPLTAEQGRYCRSIGIPWYSSWAEVGGCQLILDGLFGFGLSRPLTGDIAAAVARINQCHVPVLSIDLPSGIHTDSGEVLGTAIQAELTLCLGLWKRAFLQEAAQPYLGQVELIDFDIPLANIEAVLGAQPQVRCLMPERAIGALPLKRSPIAHKYTVGHLLVIAGSRRYGGAALLTGYGAMASGVGMVTMVVPGSMRSHLITQLPEALVIGTEETPAGTIAILPPLAWERYDAIACGPGLSQVDWLQDILSRPVPLLLDADGLNGITANQLTERSGLTIITPHPGEFRRLFPELSAGHDGARQAAQMTGATVVLKGAKVAIASPSGQLWLNFHSTPALARGGSGDVLTGLMGGLLAQRLKQMPDAVPDAVPDAMTDAALGAVWWHAQAGLYAQQRRTVLGVNPLALAQCLNPALAAYLNDRFR